MPNLVYYKDGSGVVSGPLKEDEATALFKANFFGPDHVFRIVDSKTTAEFFPIDDLRSLNGDDTPFGLSGNEQKELVRVYKELMTVIKERNELQRGMNVEKIRSYDDERKEQLEEFMDLFSDDDVFTVESEDIGDDEWRCFITNNSMTSVRCLIADSWVPAKSRILDPKCKISFPDDESYIYIAPHLSDDPHDGSEHVRTFHNADVKPINFE